MSAFETVTALVHGIRAARQPVQGEWADQRGRVIAWVDEHVDERIIITGHLTAGIHVANDWMSHPAVFVLTSDERAPYAVPPDIALASWMLEDGALDAVLAVEVEPDYARAAHRAGVTDAWQLIEAWRSGIPVEFLSALGGAA